MNRFPIFNESECVTYISFNLLRKAKLFSPRPLMMFRSRPKKMSEGNDWSASKGMSRNSLFPKRLERTRRNKMIIVEQRSRRRTSLFWLSKIVSNEAENWSPATYKVWIVVAPWKVLDDRFEIPLLSSNLKKENGPKRLFMLPDT